MKIKTEKKIVLFAILCVNIIYNLTVIFIIGLLLYFLTLHDYKT